jgi:hypothetical protein
VDGVGIGPGGGWVPDEPGHRSVVEGRLVLRVRPARVVRGVVLASDGTPLVGSRIWVFTDGGRTAPRAWAESGEEGAFELHLARSAREIEVVAMVPSGPPGSDVAAEGFVDVAEVPDPLVLRFEPGAVVEGRVVDERGDPVQGATIHAASADRVPLWDRVGETGADGRFRIGGLPRGATWVQAWPTRADLGTSDPTRVLAPTAEAQVTCPDAWPLQGRILAKDPSEFRVLWIRRAPHARERTPSALVQPGPDGTFVIQRATGGDTLLYAYRAAGDLYAWIERPRAQDGEILVRPVAGGRIAGRFVDGRGEGVRVTYAPEWSGPNRALEAAHDGTFTLPCLPPGRYDLRIQDDPAPPRLAPGGPFETGSHDLVIVVR